MPPQPSRRMPRALFSSSKFSSDSSAESLCCSCYLPIRNRRQLVLAGAAIDVPDETGVGPKTDAIAADVGDIRDGHAERGFVACTQRREFQWPATAGQEMSR